jgi:hypothetical protein
MITLNEDQEIAIKAIKDFILDSDPSNDIFTLQGVAGAGKTTSAIYALEEFKSTHKIVGGTISHSAKFVLEKSLERARIPCFTVAQLLNMVQKIDEETGNISFVPAIAKQKSPLTDADIILIDECSMLGPDLIGYLNSRKKLGSKIIYMGDEAQLCPIGDENLDSPAFEYVGATLNVPMRYSGPLADLGLRLRKEIGQFKLGEACSKFVLNNWQTDELGYKCRTSSVNEEGNGYIFLNDIDKVVEIAVNAFKNDESPDAMRLIAFRNATIKKLNDYTRSILYNEEDLDHLPQFMPNELVICEGGYAAKMDKRSFDRPCIYNNEVFKVTKVIPTTGPDNIPALMPVLYPPVKLQEGERVYALDERNGGEEYRDKLEKLKRYAKADGKQWRNYYTFQENFAWFTYNYSSTAHRCQGRTYKDVIVFEKDILEVNKINTKVKLQSLHVACTRAQRRVYIYNSKYKVDQSLVPQHIREELGI